MTESPSDGQPSRSWTGPALWSAVALALVAWVIWRIELLPFGSDDLPRAFFTVDHPFHTARADLIARFWSDLDTIRWVASHQGGYPAEFFPFGVPGVAAALHLLTGGTLVIESAWTLTIVALFLLPGVGYALLAWCDRLSPATALVALAAHLTIASDWTHGGYSELVEWGLATNVAGATLALIALPLLTAAVGPGTWRWVGASAAVIALCTVSNPRSLIAVAVVAVTLLLQRALRDEVRAAVVRLAVTATLAIGLCAPVLVPLLRYNDRYFFLSYQEYTSVGAYLNESVISVSWPVFALAAAGTGIALARRQHRTSHVAALALVLYMTLTAIAVAIPALRELVPQLELPRLMPFQRLLTLWLAAFGLLRLVALLRVGWSRWRDAGVAVAAATLLAVVFTTGVGPLPPEEQGLRHVPRLESADAAELQDFRGAVGIAADAAAPDTAILVIGSRLSWHQQLWAPMVAPERRFLYNDWLWFWHRDHAGPYDYRNGHFYPDPGDALDPDYLATHGVGAVVLADAGSARQRAATSAELDRIEGMGAWEVFVVRDSSPLATLDGSPPNEIAVSEDGERITVRFEAAEPGELLVRQHAFPRWVATVNGDEVEIQRGTSGYITVPISTAGEVEIELRYTLTPTDATARVAAVASALVLLLLLLGVTPRGRWARR